MTFGINDFGMSAPCKDIFEHFGLTVSNITNKTKKMLKNQIWQSKLESMEWVELVV